jgi:hypothetical protein
MEKEEKPMRSERRPGKRNGVMTTDVLGHGA